VIVFVDVNKIFSLELHYAAIENNTEKISTLLSNDETRYSINAATTNTAPS